MCPRRPSALVLTALLALPGCATAPREPWVLDSSDLTTSPTRRADWLDSYPRVLATILDVFERDLGLPRLQVRLVFLPDRPTLEQLLLEIGYSPALARDAAGEMVAIGGYRTMLLNERQLSSRSWPDRAAVVAHELTHALQYELGGGVRGDSEQWLREGYADWVEVRVLGAVGLVDEAATGGQALEALRAAGGAEDLPRLAALATFPSWVAQVRGQGGDVLYTQAQAAVSFLIERHGQDAVLRYFSLFATAQDREGNFHAAFGENLDTFERAFRRHVWGSEEGRSGKATLL